MKRTTLAVAIALLCTVAADVGAAQQPDELALTRKLADAGAPQLVLDRVSRLQPQRRMAAQWNDWEALRCTALAALGRHAPLLARVAALAPDARAEALSVCYTSAARAAHALGRYADARRHAARALWQYGLAPAEVQALRRLVIDSYVGEGRGEHAYRAMLRYQQDHRPLTSEVLGGFAGGLLDAGMEKEALAWLAQLDDSQPAKLRLRLRAALVPRDAAIGQARAALARTGDPGYWSVILDAAADAAGLPVRVEAYEQLLNRREQSQPDTAVAVRRLWDAYLATASASANRAGLLVGDDASWADFAGRRLGSAPSVARALFAHLAQRAQSAVARQNAQLQLLHAYRSDGLEHAALRVFGASFPDVDALDTQVRYRLGMMAEGRRLHAMAARYWQDLPVPPETDAGEWLLRVSRQRWRAGAEDTNADAVARYYSNDAGRRPLSASAAELAAGYAEDLAERGQHGAARHVLEAVLPHAQPDKLRSLLHALGRARELAGELPLAGEAYLRAALLAQAPADPAAARARMSAGVAFARAGYLRDARMQLQWVIENSKDAALAEGARSELQKLQL